MCGIVGAIDFTALKNKQQGSLSLTLLSRMRDVMEHRGTDGFGEWISKDHCAIMGHRRLSIIDLNTSANQPMHDEHSKLTIVFNGEIYNHADLRQELIQEGVTDWKTDHSDTEVLLKTWRRWGVEGLHKLRGMFAFAIWDQNTKTLTLVRDRLGVKPLYFSNTDGKVSFASEIKALIQAPWQTREVNEQGLFHYLSFLTVPAPETMFKGIYKLPAGHMITYHEDGSMDMEEWWNPLLAAAKEPPVPVNDVQATVLKKLTQAVNDRKVADVEVGVLLSGGVDSSINTALFSNYGQEKIKTFCIGYDTDYDSAPNEFSPAQEVSKLFKTSHYERHLTQGEVLDFLPKMVWLQDEPIADPVCVPVYFVSEEARKQGVTVTQVGEGADELFFGYRNWRAKWWMQRIANYSPAILWKMAEKLLTYLNKDHTRLFEAIQRGARKQPIFWGGVDIFTENEKQRLLSPHLREKFKNHTSWSSIEGIHKQYQKYAPNRLKHTANWMTFIDLKLRLPELLLMRLDKMCMGVELEGRVPFLDHRLVSFSLSLPERVRMNPIRLKPLLKDIGIKFLPEHIINRRKQGFALPVHEWFFNELGEEAHKTIQRFIHESNLLDQTAVNAIFERKDHQKAWYILNLAMWWELYIKPEQAPTQP